MMSHLSKLNTKSIPVFAVGFAGTFSAGLLEVSKFHGLGHNEALLKICMNTSSGLGCLSSPEKIFVCKRGFSTIPGGNIRSMKSQNSSFNRRRKTHQYYNPTFDTIVPCKNFLTFE